jgi:hypothetical protein
MQLVTEWISLMGIAELRSERWWPIQQSRVNYSSSCDLAHQYFITPHSAGRNLSPISNQQSLLMSLLLPKRRVYLSPLTKKELWGVI